MVRLTKTIGGHCYQGNGTTVIPNQSIIVTNNTTHETLDGSTISALTTNSSGEWSTNFADANWINDYNNGDEIIVEVYNSTYGKDKETLTLDTTKTQTDIDLWCVSDEVYDKWQAINDSGASADLRRQTRTFEDDYESTETETNPSSDDTITIVFIINNDEEKLFEWGVVNQGEAIGYIKGKDAVYQDDLIRYPSSSGSWWRIADKPRLFYLGNNKCHYECRLIRIN